MSAFSSENLQGALRLLGALAASRNRPRLHLVVCGGSALIALRLIERTTRDVDVLATLDGQRLDCARPLPEWLLADAEDIRRELHLPVAWLNDGPADPDLFRLGLPQGVLERLHTQSFSPTFQVSFIDRYDQVHLKLYAAADQGGRHFFDLKQLHPTGEELLAAARWTFTQDPSDGFRESIGKVFDALGYGDLFFQL